VTEIIYETSPNTHWKNTFPKKSELLGSHNLNEGEELVATFDKMPHQGTIKDRNGNDKTVTIATFINAPPMCLNITNCRIIEGLYGGMMDKWIGKSIQLYVGQVRNPEGAGTVGGLKVRERIPATDEDLSEYESALENCTTIDELKKAWMAIPKHLTSKLLTLKNNVKMELGDE